MRGLTFTLLTVFLGSAATGARAASPDAWAELYANSSAACVAAVGLSEAKVRGESADFEGAVLLIIDGRHPNGLRGTSYCLYDKVTAKTQTAPAQTGQVAAEKKPKPATGRTCWTESFAAQLKVPSPIGSPCTAKNDEGDSYSGVVRP
jgi:hypothetical protein